jgi:hypothetical protein
MKRFIDRASWGLVGALGIALLAVLAGVVNAGPLDPPGAPAPTQETLIFPPTTCAAFPIVVAGDGESFKLAGNVELPAGCAKNGIEISGPNVTLDLGGFSVEGGAGSGDGIVVEKFGCCVSGSIIRNGRVVGWSGDGIDAANGTRTVIEDVTVVSSGTVGIRAGVNSIVRGCNVAVSGNAGVMIAEGTLVDGCVVASSGAQNYLLADTAATNVGSRLTNCISSLGSSKGIEIFQDGSTVENCTVSRSATNGISTSQDGIVIRNNTVDGAGAAGITAVGTGARVEANTATNGSSVGISIGGSGNLVIRNSTRGNAGGGYSIGAGNMAGTVVTTETAMNAAANDLINIAVP